MLLAIEMFMKMHLKEISAISLFTISVSFITGCGSNQSTGAITIRSAPVSTQALASTATAAASATDFKVCVRRIRLENDSDEPETNDQDAGADESGYVEFSPGLLDLTDGQSKDWGQARVPVGFKLRRIKIKVQKHEQLCGVDYSLKYGTATANRDLEFRWRFNPEVELKDGSTVTLALEQALAAIRAAAQAGDLNKVKDYLDGADEGAATAEN